MNLVLLLVASLGAHGQAQTGQIVARYKNLAVYPIYEPLGSVKDSDYITLDEGLKSGTVTVTEKGGATVPIRRPLPIQPSTESPPTPAQQEYQGGRGPEVNSLWLVNKSGKRLILIAGEMVRGGQQDRIIGKDTIVPPTGQLFDLGVYCVEHGRWSGSVAFDPTDNSLLVVPSVRKAAQNEGSQQQVWNGVAAGRSAVNVSGGSGAYRDLATDKNVAKQVDDYVSAINTSFPARRSTGVAIAINGKMVWMDRFSSKAMFAKYWPKLLRSYAMEALTHSERVPSNPPARADAMNFVNTREGKTSYDVNEYKVKVTKIENKNYVILRLEDLATKPSASVHESKVVKD